MSSGRRYGTNDESVLHFATYPILWTMCLKTGMRRRQVTKIMSSYTYPRASGSDSEGYWSQEAMDLCFASWTNVPGSGTVSAPQEFMNVKVLAILIMIHMEVYWFFAQITRVPHHGTIVWTLNFCRSHLPGRGLWALKAWRPWIVMFQNPRAIASYFLRDSSKFLGRLQLVLGHFE